MTDALEDPNPADLLEALINRPRWQLQAACRGVDPALMYPTTGELHDDAKAVCAGCPVREDCLETAIADGEQYGIWGGTHERERRRLIRKRQQEHPPETCPNGHPNEDRSPVTGRCRTCHTAQNRRSRNAA